MLSIRFGAIQNRILLVSILALHTILLALNAIWMSPTLDEPAHLVAGISHWRFGDFSLYRVNPPLVRLVSATPAMLLGYSMDFPETLNDQFSRNEFQLGEKFVTENGRWALWLVTFGRWACIPFSLLAAWTCYLWARDLYGPRAGVVAMLLWCFSPMILGHAALMTPDAPAAALGALACYTFWRWLKKPTWQSTITAGVILGLAELSKTTLILFYPLWPVLWFVYRLFERCSANQSPAMTLVRWRNEACMLLARMLIGLYVVNVGYLGVGSFVQLKEYEFRSSMFGSGQNESIGHGNRFRDQWLGELPVPLPFDYVLGIDHQQRDFEKFWGPSYLRGQFQPQGWWYYYCYALLVKTPIGTIGLGMLVLIRRLTNLGVHRGPAFRDEWILLFPMLFVFVVVSSKWGFSHHLRYLFPCFPLAFIWISQIACPISRSALARGFLLEFPANSSPIPARRASKEITPFPRSRVGLVLWLSCLTWSLTSSLWHYPHSLAYFNEFAGGPRNGAKHLLNSSIDWGQDLLHLERWISRNANGTTVFLAFDNYYNPFLFGIKNIEPWPLKEERDSSGWETLTIPDGYYAISINQLYEFPWSVRDRVGKGFSIDKRPLKSLRETEPIGRIGYSILIFNGDQIRRAYSLNTG